MALKISQVKERLHQLVDLIDDEADMAEALDYLRWLAADEDDEPLTDEDVQAIEASRAAIAAGEVVPWEQAKRELDL